MDLPRAIDRIRQSTVQIAVLARTDQKPQFGSGFIVHADGWIVTARHVLRDAETALDKDGGSLVAGLAIPNVDTGATQVRASFSLQGVEVVDRSVEHDLALLRCLSGTIDPFRTAVAPGHEPPSVGPAVLDAGRPIEGTAIAISGYPFGEPTFVTNSGCVASSWATAEALTGSLQGERSEIRDRYLGDLTSNFGNSGGPVYRIADSAVIGMHDSSRLRPVTGGAGAHAAGVTVIIPSKYVLELLARNGVMPAGL